MINRDYNTKAFFALLSAGLWENSAPPSSYLIDYNHLDIDWDEVHRLASEQSALGLVLAGLDSQTLKQGPPTEQLLEWIVEIQMVELQNQAMNNFLGELLSRLRESGINAVLVKGQGVAQCYERPMWRLCGDVDLLLDEDNYLKAKALMAKIASNIEPERARAKHIGYCVDQWMVELHAPSPESLKRPIYRVMMDVWDGVFNRGNVRVWNNGGVEVFLPSPDNDIIIIFTHLLGHFCFGGIGLRQICDLCRLLWVYRDEIDHNLLRKRLEGMGLMTEWKVFASLMVNWLGMPEQAMPFYSDLSCYKRKANRVCKRILLSGDLGVNVDSSYRTRKPKWKSNLITFKRRTAEFFCLMRLFPMDAPRFFCNYLVQKVKK